MNAHEHDTLCGLSDSASKNRGGAKQDAVRIASQALRLLSVAPLVCCLMLLTLDCAQAADGQLPPGDSIIPNIAPPSGSATNGTLITIDAPGTIRYRVQGEGLALTNNPMWMLIPIITPSPNVPFDPQPENSWAYEGPFVLPVPSYSTSVPASATVVALVFQDGMFSAWNTNIYTFPTLPLPTLQIDRTDAGTRITLASSIAEAELVYGFGYNLPIEDASTVYSAPLNLSPSARTFLTVVVRKPGLVSSVARFNVYLPMNDTVVAVEWTSPTSPRALTNQVDPGIIVLPPTDGRVAVTIRADDTDIVLSWEALWNYTYGISQTADLRTWAPLVGVTGALGVDGLPVFQPLLFQGTEQNLCVKLRTVPDVPRFFRLDIYPP